MSAPPLIGAAQGIAASDRPIRERLRRLIEIAAEARKLPDLRERRLVELGVWRAALPLLEDDERPRRRGVAVEEPLPDADLAAEVRAAAARRARREALVPAAAEVPVDGPRWASRILDTGEEVVGVHRDTGTAYPLELFADLDEEASAAVVADRLSRRGFTADQVGAVLAALQLPGWARRRVLEALEGGERPCR